MAKDERAGPPWGGAFTDRGGDGVSSGHCFPPGGREKDTQDKEDVGPEGKGAAGVEK